MKLRPPAIAASANQGGISESMNAKRNLKREQGGRRVVVKVGTALITGGGGRLNLETMASLVSQIARLRADGWLMSLVSSGAVAAGRGALPDSAGYRNIPMRQALAAIGQGRLMNVYEQLFGWRDVQVAQALLTNRDINDREGYLNIRNTLTGLMDYGIVPIINENDVVSVDELGGRSFGDNDMLSAMVANIVDADMLIMLGHVDGLFTGDPHSDPKARLVPEVSAFTDEIAALAGPSADGRGRGGMVTKLQAARLATSSGVRVVIAGGRTPNVIPRLLEGEALGTRFPTNVTRIESRKRYLLSQTRGSEALTIDDGAVKALAFQNRSLLPVGVAGVVGDFERGAVVTVTDARGQPVARGISNYGSQDVRRIMRLRSDMIERTLGHYYGDEVIHRDNIVMLEHASEAPVQEGGRRRRFAND